MREICGCEPLWSVGKIIEDAIARVRAQVGKGKVLLGLSGGVDSSVVAALLHKAIGDQLVCVFVDHGLLRLNEGEQVMEMFAENLGVKVIRVDAEERFLDELRGEPTPRRSARSSAAFIKVFDDESHKLAGHRVPGAGHYLPGRHRVRRRQDRQGARHQVAPQRGRPAGQHAHETGRAAP